MFLRSPPSRTNNVHCLQRNVDVHHEVEHRQDRGWRGGGETKQDYGDAAG